MSDNIFNINNDPVINYLERALDGAAKRHQVLSNNLANVDTPNFKRSDVPFMEELNKAIGGSPSMKVATTDTKHISNITDNEVPLVVIQDNSTVFRNDGNNVDIDKEIVEMVKNNILYNTYVQLLTSRLEGLIYSIEEGKR